MSLLPSGGGNGKFRPETDAHRGWPELFPGDSNPELAAAISWLRHRRDHGHYASCQCQRCIAHRSTAREAVREVECTCGWCPRCWAEGEILAGRL